MINSRYFQRKNACFICLFFHLKYKFKSYRTNHETLKAWYIQSNILHGDICLVQHRHQEFCVEKANDTCYKTIQKRDAKCPGQRFMIFVSYKIISYNSLNQTVATSCGKILHLINMDAHFYNHYEKKEEQWRRLGLLQPNA